MQTAILSQLSCSLVPHSTRPFWHQKWEQQCQKQQNEVPKPSNSARRRLFQEEMDPEEEKSNQVRKREEKKGILVIILKEFVQRLLAELAERYKQKWNFDFDQGQPMNAANHPLKYEAVSAKQVPGFYRISTIFGQNPPHKNVHHERDENHWSPAEENASKMNEGIGKFVEGKATDLDGQMMAESGIGPMKSPSRILAKSKRRTTENETPKRSKKVSGSNRNSSMEWAMEEGTNGQIAGEQSKITGEEFGMG